MELLALADPSSDVLFRLTSGLCNYIIENQIPDGLGGGFGGGEGGSPLDIFDGRSIRIDIFRDRLDLFLPS